MLHYAKKNYLLIFLNSGCRGLTKVLPIYKSEVEHFTQNYRNTLSKTITNANRNTLSKTITNAK